MEELVVVGIVCHVGGMVFVRDYVWGGRRCTVAEEEEDVRKWNQYWDDEVVVGWKILPGFIEEE
jgi:hypothetical protein